MIHKVREMMQFKVILIAGAFALAILGAGCGDDDEVRPPEEFAPPTDLVAVNGDGQVTLTWEASPDENLDKFAAYNVYGSDHSIADVAPAQLSGFLLGSVDAPNHSWSYNVTNGEVWYFHVRCEDNDGKLSGGTNEERAAGRDEGTGVIIEEFVSNGDSGFDFSAGQTVSLNQNNPNRFDTDIYLGTTDNEDDPAQPLALKSPHLLANHGTTGWDQEIAGIKYLGTQWEISSTTTDGFVDLLTFDTGSVFAVKTPDGNYAKMQITNISGSAGSRTITFNWSHQATVGLTEF